MKKLQTIIASALVAGLMLSSIGTAFAEGPTETTANIFGEITAKDMANSSEGLVEIKTKQGPIKVKLTADTQYKSGSFIDISTGKKVAVVANETNGTLIATKVLVIPSEPTYKHLVGVITSTSETTATVSISNNEISSNPPLRFTIQSTGAATSTTPVMIPGQHVTAVVPKDLRAMKIMAVRVSNVTSEPAIPPDEVPPTAVSSGGKAEVPPTKVQTATKVAPSQVAPTEVTSATTSAYAVSGTKAIAKVVCVKMSPDLVKEVCVTTSSELSRDVFIDMSPDQVKKVWMDTSPELAKEIWMSLPVELTRERWLRLSPEYIKELWMSPPPELATEEIWLDTNSQQLKQIWMEMPPQLAKKICLDLPPEQAKEVWMHIPPEQIKQIWMDLPTENVKQVWMEMPTETETTSTRVGKVKSISAVKVKKIEEIEEVEILEQQ